MGNPFSDGFRNASLHQGPHVCQIYTEDHERMDAVYDFIKAGLKSGVRTTCLTGQPTETILDEFAAYGALPLPGNEHTGPICLAINREFYLKDGIFDPQRILGQWEVMLADARAEGFSGTWAIADVLPELRYLHGGTELVIYESRLDDWMEDHQATIVCQYDARIFDGNAIMAVLKVHPMVLANGQVLANPFFAPPDRLRSH